MLKLVEGQQILKRVFSFSFSSDTKKTHTKKLKTENNSRRPPPLNPYYTTNPTAMHTLALGGGGGGMGMSHNTLQHQHSISNYGIHQQQPNHAWGTLHWA